MTRWFYRGLAAIALVGAVAMTTADAQGGRPVIERLNPEGLSKPATYSHVVKVRGGTTIYIAGQVSQNAKGELVGAGDLAAQTRQVFTNLELALEGSGATFADVVKFTIYMRDASQIQLVRDIRSQFVGQQRPASTLVEVSRLADPGFLIEIEAIAVVAN